MRWLALLTIRANSKTHGGQSIMSAPGSAFRFRRLLLGYGHLTKAPDSRQAIALLTIKHSTRKFSLLAGSTEVNKRKEPPQATVQQESPVYFSEIFNFFSAAKGESGSSGAH